MTDRRLEVLRKFLVVLQIASLVSLFLCTLAVAVDQNSVAAESSQSEQDQRLMKLETQHDSMDKTIEADSTRIQLLESKTIDIQEQVIRLQDTTENILKLLYFIAASVGTMILETLYRWIRLKGRQ